MKKVLLTAAAASLLSTSAFATENAFFVKAEGGFSKFKNVSQADNGSTNKIKFKSSGFMGVGVGYYMMENVRFDLTYNHFFKPKANVSALGKKFAKETFNVDALMVNGMIDVIESGEFKAFVGAGAGLARVKSKVKHTDTTIVDGKAKTKNNFGFAAHLGASYAVSEGIDLDLTYSYRYFGKTASIKNSKTGAKYYSGRKLNSHNIGLGVRFEI